jgi:hypothetical protein
MEQTAFVKTAIENGIATINFYHQPLLQCRESDGLFENLSGKIHFDWTEG